MDVENLFQHLDIGEDKDIELKSAEGGLPKDVWETVSAFANTDGGYIILGVTETKAGITISGVSNHTKLLKNFWDIHNNQQKLSTPICSDSNVQVTKVEGDTLVIIQVPRATRTQRPVYINNNPMTGSYKRNYEGDYHCTTNVEKKLREIVGDNYSGLTEIDRIILVLAHQFKEIRNTDIQHYCGKHPRDIGECLKRLVRNSWLEQSGRGRGTYYALPNRGSPNLLSLLPSSEHYDPNSEHYDPNSEHYDPNSEHYERLRQIAAPIREKGRTNKELVEQVILELCSEHYLQLRTLAELLGRSPDSIRNHYVNPMLSRELLKLKYPEQINHPQQAYRTVPAPTPPDS